MPRQVCLQTSTAGMTIRKHEHEGGCAGHARRFLAKIFDGRLPEVDDVCAKENFVGKQTFLHVNEAFSLRHQTCTSSEPKCASCIGSIVVLVFLCTVGYLSSRAPESRDPSQHTDKSDRKMDNAGGGDTLAKKGVWRFLVSLGKSLRWLMRSRLKRDLTALLVC